MAVVKAGVAGVAYVFDNDKRELFTLKFELLTLNLRFLEKMLVIYVDSVGCKNEQQRRNVSTIHKENPFNWLFGLTVSTLDSESSDCGFESRPIQSSRFI